MFDGSIDFPLCMHPRAPFRWIWIRSIRLEMGPSLRTQDRLSGAVFSTRGVRTPTPKNPLPAKASVDKRKESTIGFFYVLCRPKPVKTAFDLKFLKAITKIKLLQKATATP